MDGPLFFSPEIHHFAGKLSQMRINRERLPLACFVVHQPCSCVAELFKLGQCNGGRRHDSFPGLSLNSRENLLLLFNMILSVKTVSVEHISRYIRKLARVAISIYPCLVSLVVSTSLLPAALSSPGKSGLGISLCPLYLSSDPTVHFFPSRNRDGKTATTTTPLIVVSPNKLSSKSSLFYQHGRHLVSLICINPQNSK